MFSSTTGFMPPYIAVSWGKAKRKRSEVKCKAKKGEAKQGPHAEKICWWRGWGGNSLRDFRDNFFGMHTRELGLVEVLAFALEMSLSLATEVWICPQFQENNTTGHPSESFFFRV